LDEWCEATSGLNEALHHLHFAKNRVDELILVLAEIAGGIKRKNAAGKPDPYWADFVAKVDAINFAVSSTHSDEVELLQRKCEQTATAMLGDDDPPSRPILQIVRDT